MLLLKMKEFNETLDDLQNGYYLIQRDDGFKFGVDAVLLADFAKNARGRAIDLCTGTGIVPILLAAKSKLKEIDAIEIQEEIADMAKRSVEYNELEKLIHIKCGDLNDAVSFYGKAVFDAVTVNPPYMKAGAGLVNDGDIKLISRHEVKCTLEEVIRVSSELLKPCGKIYMVHRPSRLPDIICCMRKFGIEPKVMRLVAPRMGKEANLVLIHGMKNAKSELKLLPTLYVYGENGEYSKEIDEIYGR